MSGLFYPSLPPLLPLEMSSMVPPIDTLENIMKRLMTIFAAIMLITLISGCKKNPNAFIQFPEGPEYVGTYIDTTDIRHIGYALNTAATRVPVKWENPTNGYQYSLMVFTTDAAMGTTTRKFTILTIEPSGDAEVLNLIGTSKQKNIWNIVAETPASSVGKAARMDLAKAPTPKATHSHTQDFPGFMLAN